MFTVHRILTPDEAEGILERDEADGVTLVRALIADPEWVNKARDGAPREIRACTGCNQGCYGNLRRAIRSLRGEPGRRAGRDGARQRHADAGRGMRKRVVVVGGGPGGLEAAWVAAARATR